MLDKILILNKHEAVMVFTDRDPFKLYSDKDVKDIIEIMIMPTHGVRAVPFIDTTREDTITMDLPVAA
jgi:hypothetical protein